MSQHSEETKAALTDVRKAFRLLWAYNKRVFHIVQRMNEQLGFTFYYSDNWIAPKNSGSDFCTRWAWDALPTVTTGWLMLRPNKNEDGTIVIRQGDHNSNPLKGEMLLHILLVSDSGFSDVYAKQKSEPDSLKFVTPESAESRLILSIYVNDVDRKEKLNWCDNIFKPNASKADFLDNFKKENLNNDIRRYSKSYLLEELLDEEGLMTKINDFQESAEKALKVSLGLS
jgi:hypothetical protein